MESKKENALLKIFDVWGEDKILQYGEGEHSVKVRVKATLPFTQRMEMIRDIARMVFTDTGDSIDCYVPAFVEFAKRYAAITYYTDAELPSEPNELWHILNNSPLYEQVSEIVREELEIIFRDAEETIRAKRDHLVGKTDILHLFDRMLKTLENQFSGIEFGEIKDILKNLPKMSAEETVDFILKSKSKESQKEGE